MDMIDPNSAADLDDLHTGIRSVLGDDLIGLYLFGSADTAPFIEMASAELETDPWARHCSPGSSSTPALDSCN